MPINDEQRGWLASLLGSPGGPPSGGSPDPAAAPSVPIPDTPAPASQPPAPDTAPAVTTIPEVTIVGDPASPPDDPGPAPVTIPEITIVGDPAAPPGDDPGTPAMAAIPIGPPSPGDDKCRTLLQAIIDQLKLLEQLFEEATTDARRLWQKERQGIPDDSGTTWSGHKQSYEKQRDELRRRLADWDKDCGDKILTPEEQEEVEMAQTYAGKPFPDRPEYAKREQTADDRPLVDEGATFDKVLKVFTVLGLSLALVPEVVVAAADPEPVTKLAAIGLTAATIVALGKVLGFDTSSAPPEA